MTTGTYTPREGSAAWKVVQFLRANPDERLDADLVAAKCDCGRASVHTLLGPSVQAGLLKRSEDLDSGELVYTLGANCAELVGGAAPTAASAKRTSAAAGPAAKPKAAPAERRPPAPPFCIDLSTIKVEKGVALPGPRITMDWTPLLAGLDVGDSFVVPYAARSSITSAMKAFKDATKKELVSRTVDGQIRVWRTK